MAGYDIMFSALKQGRLMDFFERINRMPCQRMTISRESFQKNLRQFIVVPVHPHMYPSKNWQIFSHAVHSSQEECEMLREKGEAVWG